MKKMLFVLFVTLISFMSFSQNQELIVGNWMYQDLYEKEKVDEEGLKIAERFFKDLSLGFTSDGIMKLTMMGKVETGKYSFDKTNTTIINAASDKGTEMVLNIVKLDENQLIIKLDKAGNFIMKRSDTKVIIDETTKVVEEPVVAKLEQITKKWYVLDVETNKKKSKLSEELSKDLLKDSFYLFKKNKTFSNKIVVIEQSGTWEFSNENKSIITFADDEKQIWDIIKITEDELILRKGRTGNKIYLSSKVKL